MEIDSRGVFLSSFFALPECDTGRCEDDRALRRCRGLAIDINYN